MSFIASITAWLQNFGVQRPSQDHTHTLFLEYPATNLIPRANGLCLRMEPPKSAAYRSQPDRACFFLDEFGLEYSVRLPITSACQIRTSSEDQLPIIDKVQQLARCGGKSTLEVVTDARGFWRCGLPTETHVRNTHSIIRYHLGMHAESRRLVRAAELQRSQSMVFTTGRSHLEEVRSCILPCAAAPRNRGDAIN